MRDTFSSTQMFEKMGTPRPPSRIGISDEYTRVSYATVADAIRLVKAVGPGCFMAKTDIKNAFRIIPIRPQDHNLFGIC